jgi:hypothetical protein
MNEDNYHNFDNDPKECDFENPFGEKWIVSFIRLGNLKKIYYRQFFAAGFYEAYDMVMTFVEKTNYEILWYKEKRKCEAHFANKEIPNLEFVCTFCNNEFNNNEPIKCNFESGTQCKSEFCSLHCRQEHFYLMHIKRKTY